MILLSFYQPTLLSLKNMPKLLVFYKNVLTSTSQLPSFLSSKKLQGKAQTSVNLIFIFNPF
jgi:hypothetical protein